MPATHLYPPLKNSPLLYLFMLLLYQTFQPQPNVLPEKYPVVWGTLKPDTPLHKPHVTLNIVLSLTPHPPMVLSNGDT